MKKFRAEDPDLITIFLVSGYFIVSTKSDLDPDDDFLVMLWIQILIFLMYFTILKTSHANLSPFADFLTVFLADFCVDHP